MQLRDLARNITPVKGHKIKEYIVNIASVKLIYVDATKVLANGLFRTNDSGRDTVDGDDSFPWQSKTRNTTSLLY